MLRRRHGLEFHQHIQVALGWVEAIQVPFSLASDDRTVYAPWWDDNTKTGGILRFDLSTGQQAQIYRAPDDTPGLGVVTRQPLDLLCPSTRPGPNNTELWVLENLLPVLKASQLITALPPRPAAPGPGPAC